ncbi:ABC transporter permease [Aquincola tertiaricarbonis]|uniref:ABC transporter permease n=1 Tax=Aquincola tertiaricarbonis TaxID=391953 RepID=A0ABY4RZL0_AQUTE|nr:ABC transporter permease [Aquincola tertiaricarbonis]URI06037.1 ABC transporter permease [Aquincola tertiaricarbonis]
MTPLITLAARSAWNRRFTLMLTVASIALATLLLMGIERLRTDLRANFSSAVSGTDLIVGARTGSTQLLLYSVFRIGAATNNMGWASVQALAAHRAVAWVVPISLGDSHRGYPVLGTSGEYFERFRYGNRQPLKLAEGRAFNQLFEAVLGADVAEQLGYKLGQRLTLAHGSGELVAEHADKPFVVTGILARTGTPVDRTVHISLESMEALHVDWVGGVQMPGRALTPDQLREMNLQPKAVTAALVGLKSRPAVFSVQRWVADYRAEPLMAILPGVALDELWEVVGVGEKALLAMSVMVGVVSLAGLVSVVLAGLNERRRELAVLRAVGAGPRHVLALLALEGALVTLAGALLGLLLALGGAAALGPWLQSRHGLVIGWGMPSTAQWMLFAAVVATGWLASLLPALRAYRLSLVDGLSPRI